MVYRLQINDKIVYYKHAPWEAWDTQEYLLFSGINWPVFILPSYFSLGRSRLYPWFDWESKSNKAPGMLELEWQEERAAVTSD